MMHPPRSLTGEALAAMKQKMEAHHLEGKPTDAIKFVADVADVSVAMCCNC